MDLKFLKFSDVEKAPEILIYFWIEGLGDVIHSMRRAYQMHDADSEVLDAAALAREDQKQLVEMLKQREGFAFADHDEYMRWYRWWNRWHKHVLTDLQWSILDQLLDWDGTQTEETYAAWRPEGNWREAVEAPSC